MRTSQRKHIVSVELARRADVVSLEVLATRWGAGFAVSLPGGRCYGFRTMWRDVAQVFWDGTCLARREWIFSLSIGPLAGYVRALRSRRRKAETVTAELGGGEKARG